MKKYTITIGIPVYNEEKNIGFLIKNLLNQQTSNSKIEKIIICSDGSTDNSVSIAKSIKSKLITVLENKKRGGKSEALNQIISLCKSDILVLLDADILIKDTSFIEKLTKPQQLKNADLTSPRIQEIGPQNIIESILEVSMNLKKKIYKSVNYGNNIYTCFGRAMAFSRRLYANIHFSKEIVSDDAYAYLYCISKKYIYRYVDTTELYYKLPGSIEDHEKQSVRFFSTRKQLYSLFGEEFVKSEYRISPKILLPITALFFLKQPLLLSVYIGVVVCMKILSFFHTSESKWEIANSSKLIV